MARKISIVDGFDLLHGLGCPITLVQAGKYVKVVIELLHVLHELPDGNPVGFLEAIADVVPLCFSSIVTAHREHVECDTLLKGVPRLAPGAIVNCIP